MKQQKITKAIIVAAGLSSRMYPFTKEMSKLSIPIINKPVVEYLVEELAASGIKEVIIVSSHTSLLRRFFTKDQHLNDLLRRLKKESLIEKFHHIETLVKVDLIRQDKPMGWMHEVWNARKHLKDGPFVVCFSDVLYKSKIPVARQIIEKFQKTGKNISTTGRFVFKPDIFKILEKEHFALGSYDTDVDVYDKLKQNNDLLQFKINGEFYNIGDPLSYMKTVTVFALDDKEIGKEYKKFFKDKFFERELGKNYRGELIKNKTRDLYKKFLEERFQKDFNWRFRKFIKTFVWREYNKDLPLIKRFLKKLIK